MCDHKKKTEVLGDLFKINQDCSASLSELMWQEPELSSILQKLLNIEQDHLLELRKEVDPSFGDPADAVERRGEVYLEWQRRNSTPLIKESETCSLCEKRMKDIIVAYNKAIQKSSELSEQLTRMLQSQAERLREAFAAVVKRSRENQHAHESMAV